MAKPIKWLIIVCGPARSGKDTAIDFMAHFFKATHPENADRDGTSEQISSVDEIASFIRRYNISRRDDVGRRVMSKIKKALEEEDFLVTRANLKEAVKKFSEFDQVFLQIREASAIQFLREHIVNEDYQQTFNVQLAVIKVISQKAIDNCPDNDADREAITIEADYTIENNGTLGELSKEAIEAALAIQKLGQIIHN